MQHLTFVNHSQAHFIGVAQSQRGLTIRISRVREGGSDLPLPSYATTGSSGMDLRADIVESVTLRPSESVLIPTGISIELPSGYEAQVRPRSGLALKHQVGVLNSPGTIDSDYRGEVQVILMNFGKAEFQIHRGDRIAQLVVASVAHAEWEEVSRIDQSARGDGGFGHTGR